VNEFWDGTADALLRLSEELARKSGRRGRHAEQT